MTCNGSLQQRSLIPLAYLCPKQCSAWLLPAPTACQATSSARIAGRDGELWPQQQTATWAHHLQAMWDLGHCDKKRCTGTRLMRLHVVSEIRLGTPFPGVILSPNGKRCVSVEDQELIAAKGLAVVDCSWNRLDDVPFSEPACGKDVVDRMKWGWQWAGSSGLFLTPARDCALQ